MNFAHVSGWPLSPVYLRVHICSLPSVSANHPISFQSVPSIRKNQSLFLQFATVSPECWIPRSPDSLPTLTFTQVGRRLSPTPFHERRRLFGVIIPSAGITLSSQGTYHFPSIRHKKGHRKGNLKCLPVHWEHKTRSKQFSSYKEQ